MILPDHGRYVRAPIDKFGYYGLYVRHRLLECILYGTPVSMALQNRRTPFRTAVMSFFSFLGTEDCFTCVIALLTWVLDDRLGRLFTILLLIGFYVAGFFKCLLCLPRPPSPPIIPLHKEDDDWAFPSNHGTVSVLVPWYLWIYCLRHYDWFPWWSLALMFCVALAWFCGVTLSRLYLGVHSLADMVSGAVAGVWILVVYVLADEFIDYQCVAGEYVVAKALIAANILMYIHPRTKPETNSYGECVVLIGSAMGLVASRTLTFSNCGRDSLIHSMTASGELFWRPFILRSVLRLFIGTSMILGGRVIFKPLVKNICYSILSNLGIPVYSYRDFSRQHPPVTKHYTDAYRLPPLITSDCSSLTKTDQAVVKNGGKALSNGLSRRVISSPKKSVESCNGAVHKDSWTTTGSRFDDHAAQVCFGEKLEFIENSNGEIHAGVEDGVNCLPYDVDVPTRFVTYSLLGWILGEGAPAVFELIGI